MIINTHYYTMNEPYGPSLDNYTWSELAAIAAAGSADLQLGSCKHDGKYACTLIGIDQDIVSGQTGSLTFSLGRVSTEAAFTLGSYGSSYYADGQLVPWKTLYTTQAIKWTDLDFYRAGLLTDVRNSLSAGLQAQIKTVEKVSYANYASQTASNTTGTYYKNRYTEQVTLFPPSIYEIYGMPYKENTRPSTDPTGEVWYQYWHDHSPFIYADYAHYVSTITRDIKGASNQEKELYTQSRYDVYIAEANSIRDNTSYAYAYTDQCIDVWDSTDSGHPDGRTIYSTGAPGLSAPTVPLILLFVI